MHTTKELDRTSFEYQVHGDGVSRETVMPRVTPEERVGVVMGTGIEGLGAGTFILSCVTAFYEALLNRLPSGDSALKPHRSRLQLPIFSEGESKIR